MIPGIENEEILGVVFDSCSFPSQNPSGSPNACRFSLMMGGATLKKYGEDVGKLEEVGRLSLRKHLGIVEAPQEVITSFVNKL